MPPQSPNLHEVLAAVDNVHLPHPASVLLRAYILDAVEPRAAAGYVQRRLSADGGARSLVADWIYVINSVIHGTQPRAPTIDGINAITKRDGNMCCVSGKRGTLLDPVIVAPVLLVPSGWMNSHPRVTELLIVFFGRQYFDWWSQFITNAEIYPPRQTHWLVRKSVHQALQHGTISLLRQPSSMIEFRVEQLIIGDEQPVDVEGVYALLGDHSRKGIEKVDARLIGSHARFSRSIQLVNIARTMSPGLFDQSTAVIKTSPQQLPVRVSSSHLGLRHTFLRPMTLMWRIFPMTIRVTTYKLLQRIGRWLYGPSNSSGVQRLPFGLYLKYNSDSDILRNEYHALKILEQKTTIPTPRPFDIASRGTGKDASCYLLMSRVPGAPLAICQGALSDQDYTIVVAELKDCISQMRGILRPTRYDMPICNTLGEACRDPRIRDWAPIGPCPDEASFSQHLRFPDEPSRRGHKIVFTHADLNPRNILVERTTHSDGTQGWRLSGIIDWETAGYYPEYWDCTKSMFERFRWSKRHNEMMKAVFSEFGDYTEELAVETRAWESGDGI